MSTSEIEAAMQAAMAAEDRRRELGSQSPGLGVAFALPQPPSDPPLASPGWICLLTGEGYAQQPPAASWGRPVYAPAELGGAAYPGGIAQAVQRMQGLPAAAVSGSRNVVAISPDLGPRRNLLQRLLGRRI